MISNLLPGKLFQNYVFYTFTQRTLLIICYKTRGFASFETASCGEGGMISNFLPGVEDPPWRKKGRRYEGGAPRSARRGDEGSLGFQPTPQNVCQRKQDFTIWHGKVAQGAGAASKRVLWVGFRPFLLAKPALECGSSRCRLPLLIYAAIASPPFRKRRHLLLPHSKARRADSDIDWV
jgi:hypothetical protein